MKNYMTFVLLALISACLYYVYTLQPSMIMLKLFESSIAVVTFFLVFRVLFEHLLLERIKENKSHYILKKFLTVIQIVFVTMALIAIWIENLQGLFVAYGLVAAGIAVALQDVFKNLVGGVLMLLLQVHKPGDRIEIDGKRGDIIDIGLLYTTLLEIGVWIDGDQKTGRLISLPNQFVFTSIVHNYSKDNEFIWDEISIPITYKSDWKKAKDVFETLVKEIVTPILDDAQQEMSKFARKYYFSESDTEPTVYIKLTDHWVEYTIRYVTRIRSRRSVRTKMNEMLLEEISKHKSIEIASQRLANL